MIKVIYAKFNEVRWHIRLNQLKNKSAKKIQNEIMNAIALKCGSEDPSERIVIKAK
jgi:hypothetical protein